tara:strand:+ start:6815 stop:7513 length:699 start_codon:yes stop_codon:yes gene_type:complete
MKKTIEEQLKEFKGDKSSEKYKQLKAAEKSIQTTKKQMEQISGNKIEEEESLHDLFYDGKGLLKRCGYDVILDEVIIKRPEHVTIGNHVAMDKGVYITTQADIGSYVHISPYVTCIGGKDGKFIAKGFNNIMAGARIVCGSDRFDGSGLFGAMIPNELKGTQITAPVIMEKFSNIGTNAIVLPGSHLREGVLLTAGSLLMGDTEPWGVYKGNPAVLVKKIDGTKIIENSKLM